MESYTCRRQMGILELPIELLKKILLYSVLIRGIKRALRMRLVCSELYLIQFLERD